MFMFDIDYSFYLSVDNGKGLLFSREEIRVLDRHDFDYRKYCNYGNLIFDINDYLSNTIDDVDDLEDILIRLSEKYYYSKVNK